MLALSALDIALWDLKARRANVPLFRLLGGFDARRCLAADTLLAFLSNSLQRNRRKVVIQFEIAWHLVRRNNSAPPHDG